MNTDDKKEKVESLQKREEASLTPPERFREVKADIPYTLRSPKIWQSVVRYQFLYSMSGLLLGLVCIIGGIILFLRGVTGSTSWTAKVLGLESNITDAAPGAVLFIVGLFLVFVTRFVIKAKK